MILRSQVGLANPDLVTTQAQNLGQNSRSFSANSFKLFYPINLAIFLRKKSCFEILQNLSVLKICIGGRFFVFVLFLRSIFGATKKVRTLNVRIKEVLSKRFAFLGYWLQGQEPNGLKLSGHGCSVLLPTFFSK